LQHLAGGEPGRTNDRAGRRRLEPDSRISAPVFIARGSSRRDDAGFRGTEHLDEHGGEASLDPQCE
jgi:hypothetical protein